MTVTAAQIAQVRRMVDEPTTTVYSDLLIQGFIEKYPIPDERGTDPYYYVYVGGVPTKTANVDWIETYDLNAASADIWDEKAGAVASRFDFGADGGNYTRSQEYLQAVDMAKRYRGRSHIRNVRLVSSPNEKNLGYIGNLPEPD